MSELSAKTLMVAIKAVHQEAEELNAIIKGGEDPDMDFLQMELLDVSTALGELRKVYEKLQRESDNLPLYSRIIDSE